MWRLLNADGSLFRDGFPSQWEALRTAKKADGSRFKKSEALTVESGTTVFRERFVPAMFIGETVSKDGSVGPTFLHKKSVPVMETFILEKDD